MLVVKRLRYLGLSYSIVCTVVPTVDPESWGAGMVTGHLYHRLFSTMAVSVVVGGETAGSAGHGWCVSK